MRQRSPEGLDAPPEVRSSQQVPWLIVAAVAAVAVALRSALQPLRDVDLFWHLLVGQEIVSGTPVAEAGRGWSIAPVPDTWVTTQWLSEVLLATLEQTGGLQAILVFRTVTTVLAVAVLAAVTLLRRPAVAAVWPFALAALALSMYSQDRSLQVTLMAAPLVGWWADRLLRRGQAPLWWMALPLVVVWANLHGGWVLVPVALGLAVLGRCLDAGWRDSGVRRGLVVVVLSPVVAAIAPNGPANAVAALTFAGSTSGIAEWQRVEPWSTDALPLVALTVLIVAAWALGRARPTRGEVVMTLGLLALGYQYWRSVAPITLLLAPVAVSILARALGVSDPRPDEQRERWSAPLAAVAVVGCAVAVVAAGFFRPVVNPSVPTALLQRLDATTASQRVLTDYDVSGAVLWFGGGPSHVRVSIDGRADRHGDAWFDRHQAMIGGRSGWQSLVSELDPDAAVLPAATPLAGLLVTDLGWVEAGRERGTVLLRSPDAPGWE